MRRQAAQRLGVAAGLALLAAVLFAVLLVSAHAQASDNNEPIPTVLSFAGIARAFREFWAIVGPGGKLHPAYFLEHKGHLVIEAALIVVIVYLVLQHSFKVHPRAEDPLTDKVRVQRWNTVLGIMAQTPNTSL
jgi:serine palmitoyltransferase